VAIQIMDIIYEKDETTGEQLNPNWNKSEMTCSVFLGDKQHGTLSIGKCLAGQKVIVPLFGANDPKHNDSL
jgi:hypothetical protein